MERLPNRYPKISQSHKVPLYKGLSLFYPKLRKKLYAGTCHILKSGYIFFGIAYISVSSIILIAWNA